jgi:hypothetical protein
MANTGIIVYFLNAGTGIVFIIIPLYLIQASLPPV